MRTERPAERLNRRLSGLPVSGSGLDADDDAGDGADDAILSRWLPDGEAGRAEGWLARVRADPGRAGAIALGAVAVIAVLVTVFTLVRAQPAPVLSAKLPPVQPVPSVNAGVHTSSSPAGQSLVVSVVGLVNTPGLVTLSPGARVADALSAAGGALDGADSIGLNMARRLADGEQVTVGIAPPSGGPAVLGSSVGGAGVTRDKSGPAAPSQSPGTPLDLNTATVEELDALPGVGPVTAAAIVAWRDKNGPFASVDQLSDVDGIGPARLDRLRPMVRV